MLIVRFIQSYYRSPINNKTIEVPRRKRQGISDPFLFIIFVLANPAKLRGMRSQDSNTPVICSNNPGLPDPGIKRKNKSRESDITNHYNPKYKYLFF